MSQLPILKIYIHQNDIRNYYEEKVNIHNNNILSDTPDSGFDLALPKDFSLDQLISNKIKLGVSASMYTPGYGFEGYYLYPRSSISKTPMRLANSVGIIDSGYRGEIMAVVDLANSSTIPFNIAFKERYFQLCHPSLRPFRVEIVNNIDDLGLSERGSGGFGSTGR